MILALFLKADMIFFVSSHKGFLKKYVKHLKDMGFLREDLIFSTHSEEVCFLKCLDMLVRY